MVGPELTRNDEKHRPVEGSDEGGYEARSTRAKSGAEKALIDNLLDMINEL